MDGILALVADAFLAAGAIGAALYCWILSRRLARLNNLEDGVGGAVASLARQVDEMTSALGAAHDAANAAQPIRAYGSGRRGCPAAGTVGGVHARSSSGAEAP